MALPIYLIPILFSWTREPVLVMMSHLKIVSVFKTLSLVIHTLFDV